MLNKKQKHLLDVWYDAHKTEVDRGIVFFDLAKCQCFSGELFQELERLGDFETLYQAINNYISEKGG